MENGKSILAYSPMQRGILTGKIKPGHKFGKGDHRINAPWFQPGNHEKIMEYLEGIKPIAEKHNATLAQLVINWTLQQPGITTALVGARTPEQARDNAGALDFELSSEDLDFINTRLGSLTLDL